MNDLLSIILSFLYKSSAEFLLPAHLFFIKTILFYSESFLHILMVYCTEFHKILAIFRKKPSKFYLSGQQPNAMLSGFPIPDIWGHLIFKDISGRSLQPPFITIFGNEWSILQEVWYKCFLCKCQRACGENGTPGHCWWECRLVQAQWKTIWNVFKNLWNSLLTQQFHFWECTPKILKHQYKKYMHLYVYSSVICHSQDLEIA